jgi:hypothetical protein
MIGDIRPSPVAQSRHTAIAALSRYRNSGDWRATFAGRGDWWTAEPLEDRHIKRLILVNLAEAGIGASHHSDFWKIRREPPVLNSRRAQPRTAAHAGRRGSGPR